MARAPRRAATRAAQRESARLRGTGVIATNSPLDILGRLPSGVVGQAYNFVPTATGGSGAKTFALTGTLPAGLSFNTTTGAITGTPTTAGTTSGLTITVTDSSGSAKLTNRSILVSAVPATVTTVKSMVALSQADYTALAVKDPNTLYVVI